MTQSRFAPIAIVGRSCLVPGASSPDELWQKISEGQNLLSDTPPERWRTSDEILCSPDDDSADRSWCARGGYVEGFDEIFSADGFEIPPEEIARYDTLVRWALHTAREALNDASFDGDRSQAGVILGNLSFPSQGLSRFAENVWLEANSISDEYRELIGVADAQAQDRFMSGRPALVLARALGLGGPAFALDAACASSLYAIKLACDCLHDHRVDTMLAGAVNRADDLFIHVGFCALEAMSKSGRSRPFHAAADGLVPAEGAGFVVLKRLDDAVAAGDHIYGVIRGIGLANDGRGGGLLAPAVEGQARAIRAAYEMAGITPAEIGLVECHATGTGVGDLVEVQSMASIFKGLEGVGIGSLKSNLGHLITAAGVSGLIKVLEAFRHEQKPPSLHANEVLPELENSPFRVIGALEDWPSEGPRRAAVSAFGFGGNNAHVIVEEYHRDDEGFESSTSTEPIAIVGLGARIGPYDSKPAFEEALFGPLPDALEELRTENIDINLDGLRFPPNDLKASLGQQLLVFEAAREAAAEIPEFHTKTTGIIVGMGADAEVARYGARWRVARWAEQWGVDSSWIDEAREGIVGTLTSAGVLGTMPNVPANRINAQLDLGGPSFTVSAEEASGLVALDIALRLLRSGELDTALVGAVDLSCEPVHRAAAETELSGEQQIPGDAAVVVALKRLSHAQSDGNEIYAVFDPGDDEVGEDDLKLGIAPGKENLVSRFGHAHAASGLVHVAAAALTLRRQRRPGGAQWLKDQPRKVEVEIEAMEGRRWSVVLGEDPGAAQADSLTEAGETDTAAGPVITLPAHWPPLILPPVPMSETDEAPDIPWVYDLISPLMAPVDVEIMEAAPDMSPGRFVSRPFEKRTGVDSARRQHLIRRVQRVQATNLEAHQAFLAQQLRAHEDFLRVRQNAAVELTRMMARFRRSGKTQAVEPSIESAVASTVEATVEATVESTVEPIVERISSAEEAAPIAVSVQRQPEGMKLSREGLEVHASGKISHIFGPLFEAQDGYEVQVRMPEPPLLLADRVVGLDAEAGTMGLGTVWTETDVRDRAWYLHNGRMPAGIMIESGQADLFLISYLGIDLHNRGERAYRLLGCQLTYHGDLPQAGETLCYDIHVDGHARQGDIRLFFFHYDCVSDGKKRLTVREGQAGFFNEAELEESAGVLWTPESAEIIENPRLDEPVVLCTKTSLEHEELVAFSEGRAWQCFGPGFELCGTHTRTPAIQSGNMLFLDRVTHLEARGGPWARGYLRATTTIKPDDWYFDGHFKNDPCMPGTLMLEGCLQTMAIMMTSLGYTIERDGWRFQPVPETPYDLICRGQVDLESSEIVYEVFVEEVVGGEFPELWADLLCTVDGLKAFHAKRVGLQLVPDWPLVGDHELIRDYKEPVSVAEIDDFSYGYASLLASALGPPSAAFGPMYDVFDGPRKVARLPGPPYHFMSRLTSIEGKPAETVAGVTIELEYDVPPKAWYFDENPSGTMPFCVLLEVALQPCGWLASFVGSALTVDEDLSFRNLDGSGHLYSEIRPGSGAIRTKVEITQISRTGAMIIESFNVECFQGDRLVWEMKTVFGFFPKVALENQVGLPVSDAQRAELTESSDFDVNLVDRPEPYYGSDLELPGEMLLMIDRVSAYWPDGGQYSRGRLRAEKQVDANEWFFKAHFFQDPVQPGSLGLEAMVQLLQFYMIEEDLHEGFERPQFEALALDTPLVWKYRGQVLPQDDVVTITMDIVDTGRDERGVWAIAEASLWVDDRRIYETQNLGMRIVERVEES